VSNLFTRFPQRGLHIQAEGQSLRLTYWNVSPSRLFNPVLVFACVGLFLFGQALFASLRTLFLSLKILFLKGFWVEQFAWIAGVTLGMMLGCAFFLLLLLIFLEGLINYVQVQVDSEQVTLQRLPLNFLLQKSQIISTSNIQAIYVEQRTHWGFNLWHVTYFFPVLVTPDGDIPLALSFKEDPVQAEQTAALLMEHIETYRRLSGPTPVIPKPNLPRYPPLPKRPHR